jgi:hypothetical protein
MLRNLSPDELKKESNRESLRGFVVFGASRIATIRVNQDKYCADYVPSYFDSENAMTALEELQYQMAVLQQKLADETLAEAAKQRERVLQLAKAREAEVAKGLTEIASLMHKYRLKREHLFKAAQQSGVVNGTNGGFSHGAKDNQLRADVKFDITRGNITSEPAKPQTVEEMRQFYGKLDSQLNDSSANGSSLN